MFFKFWFLICATQLVIIKGTYDPVYGGIKTKPQHRSFTNTNPNPHDNTNYGDTSLRLSTTDAHKHYEASESYQQPSSQQKQHQQQRPQQAHDAYQQRELPIYDRNAHVRQSLSSLPLTNTDSTLNEYHTGCPPQHTGPVPYSYDCRRFVNCWHGRGHIQSCGPGTVFNPETLECDRPDKVVCGTPNVNEIDKQLNTKPQKNDYRAGRLLDASIDNVQNLCPAGVSGLAPHPTDCTKFLNCDNGNTHIQKCGPGTAYSIIMKVCDFKEKVDCNGREYQSLNGRDDRQYDESVGYGSLNSRDVSQYAPQNTQNTNINGNGVQNKEEDNIFCPPGVTGHFTYPFDYTKFLNCKRGNTAIQNCSPGTVYSISKNYCDQKENVAYNDHVPYMISEVRYEFSMTMIKCPPSTDGIHLYPYDSTKYINCQQGLLSIAACPPNTIFCLSTKTCRPENEVDYSDRVRNAVDQNYNADIRDSRNLANHYEDQLLECPQAQSGLYPYPFDCNKYLQCRNGILSVETCSLGYVFSLSAKHCDPKELVDAKQQVQFQLEAEENNLSQSDYVSRKIQLTCPPYVNGYFLHPFDCTKFLICHDGTSKVENCQSGKVFSISHRQCINRNQVDAYDRVEYESEVKHEFSSESEQSKKSAVESICSTNVEGLYPHPIDNTKYVKCTNGYATVESCVEGMIFSTKRRHCDTESKVFEYDRGYGGFYRRTETVETFRKDSKYDNNNNRYNNRRNNFNKENTNESGKDSDKNLQASIQCPPQSEGMYPHPSDCTKFLICSNGVTHIKDCRPGTAWSVEMEVCDFTSNVKCTERIKLSTSNTNKNEDEKVECPANTKGLYLHPFDGHKFINCMESGTFIQSCQRGYVFSISQSMCVPKVEVNKLDYVQCDQDYTTEISLNYKYVICPTQAIGYFIYPFNGLLYIKCNSGHTMIRNCPTNTLFSISNQICIPIDDAESNDHLLLGSEWQDATNNNYATYDQNKDWNENVPKTQTTHTIITEHSSLTAFVCPSETGLYPHPTDCTKFVRCTNGISFIQDCGPGTAFNAALEVCDFKEKVSDCAAGESRDSAGCPSGVSGVFPHPYDCKRFINCDNGIANVQDCGPGTAWNVKMEVCDFVDKVDCGENRVTQLGLAKDNSANGYNVNTNIQQSSQQSHYRGGSTAQHNWQHENHEQGPSPSHRTTYGNPSQTNTYGDRWSNMDRQRPISDESIYKPESGYNSDYDRQQRLPTNSWTGTGSSIDRHTSTQSVIHEEGSLVPNRSYNRINTLTTPLASFDSDNAFASSDNRNTFINATTNIYLAEPVGSQENTDEVFDTTETAIVYKIPSNKWPPLPNQQLLPPPRTNDTDRDLNNSPSKKIHTPMPPSRVLEAPLRENPISSSTTNKFEPSNLYGGLQPPPPPSTSQSPLFYAATKIHYLDPPRPMGKSLDKNPDPITAYSSPSQKNIYPTHIFTSTPATYLQPPLMPTPAAIIQSTPSTRLRPVVNPLLENTTVATFSKDPHYSNSYSNVAHANPSSKSVEPQDYDFQNSEDLAMSEALRLLLRPYFNRSGTISENSAEKAESHIMKLTPNSTHTSSSTNEFTKNAHVGDANQKEVELIIAGEQYSLTKNPTQSPTSTPDSRKELYSKNTKQEYKSNTNWHSQRHKSEWHRNHPNLLNPFTIEEVASSPPTNHHHEHHRHNHHNKAFHERHPEIPSPFVTPDTSEAAHINPPNPLAESTTPFSVKPQLGLRSGFDCQFDCDNGKCVKSFEVCNGINNCGNSKDEEDCGHLGYEVRLTGGDNANMGRVEVKILGKWGYVCDDKFGLRDAEVVCRELGFKLGASEVRGSSYYAPTNADDVSFVMDEVDCGGDESSLKDCNFKGWGVSDCGPGEVVGVVCKVPQLKCPNNYWLCSTSQECIPPAFVCDNTPDCADKSDESDNICNSPVQYRLQGGRSPSEGRLEVRYRGEWGTVCDDDFNLKEAQVLCNSLGFYGLPTIKKNVYGHGSGPIWLDQVSCLGNETSLDQCNHWTWGEHNCNHTEDVGLKCTAGVASQKLQTSSQNIHTNHDSKKDLDDTQQQLEDIGIFPDEWERKSKAVGTQRRCGHFKDNINDEYAHPEERVVNGSLAKRGHHPWQATIRTRGRGGISSHWCGAVLISSRHLLTAAHCLAGYPKGAYLIRMGDHYANIAESSEIDSFIENWYVHEKFRDATHMNNDIALIVLKTPVKFNDYIQPVCLPTKGASLTENRKCTISGWGSIKSGVSTPSNILRAAELPILSDAICKQSHVYGDSLTEGMFCAGYMDESVDACDGDSGGPLICHDDDGETLYGIISWGQHCGYANKPGVYVRVEKYVDWIMEKINYSIQNAS